MYHLSPYQQLLRETSARLAEQNFWNAVQQETMYVKNNIEYVPDWRRGYWENWQLPQETLALQTGDCEDMAILLMALLQKHKIKSMLSIGMLTDYRGTAGHAWVTFDHKGKRWNIEATGGFVFPEESATTTQPQAIYRRTKMVTLSEAVESILQERSARQYSYR